MTEPSDDPPSGGADQSAPLQFVDLLYAVPVADLASRVSSTHLTGVSASGWTDVAVQLTAITLGWVGHHTNRRRLPAPMRDARERGRQFLTPRFPQFVVEILIIVAYFALGTQADLPGGAGVGHPSEAWKGGWLTVIFGLYLVWDVFDIGIACHVKATAWAHRATIGFSVTALFTCIFAALWVFWASGYHAGRAPQHTVWAFDLVAIGLLYAYRVIQECLTQDAKVRGWSAWVQRRRR